MLIANNLHFVIVQNHPTLIGKMRPVYLVNKTLRGCTEFSFKNSVHPRKVLFPLAPNPYLNGSAKRSSVRIFSSVIVFRKAMRSCLSEAEKFMRLG